MQETKSGTGKGTGLCARDNVNVRAVYKKHDQHELRTKFGTGLETTTETEPGPGPGDQAGLKSWD